MFRLTSVHPHSGSSDVRELAAWVAVTVACGAVVVGLVPHHGTPPSPVDAAAAVPAAPRTSASPSSSARPSAAPNAATEQLRSAPQVAVAAAVADDPLASLFHRSVVTPSTTASTTVASTASRTPTQRLPAPVPPLTPGH